MSNSKQSMPPDFIIDLKKFTAITAVTVQALRRQGIGMIGRIQEYLEMLDLYETASLKDEAAFVRWLDKHTEALKIKHKVKWGAARKALNLFLRACLYDKYLSNEFYLDRLETWLEIPLDQVIVGELKKSGDGCDRRSLPNWRGVSNLEKQDSKRFQECARRMADAKRRARVHLDVSLWVNNRKNRPKSPTSKVL